jgi:hypothetical protein
MSEPTPEHLVELSDPSGKPPRTEPHTASAGALEAAQLPPAPSGEDVEREERQCIIEDLATGAIRFTRAGFREYGPRFAQAGIDINAVRSKTAFKQACLRSEYVVWRGLRDRMKENPELMAIMQDFFDQYCLD